MQKINVFWSWFQEYKNELFYMHKYDLEVQSYYFGELTSKLEDYDKSLGFIIKYPETIGKAEMVITANGNPDGQIYVRNLIAQAPNLSNWKFTAFIQPIIDLEVCRQGKDDPYEFNEFTIKASDIKWLPVEHHEATNKLSLMVYMMGYKQIIKDIGPTTLEDYIFAIFQDLLGEAIVHKKIGNLYFDDLLFNQLEVFPIHELPEYLAE